jgi:carboxypeptidase T
MKRFAFAGILSCTLSASALAGQLVEVPNTPNNRRMIEQLDLDFGCKGTSPKALHIHLDEDAMQALSENRSAKNLLLSQGKVIEEDWEAQFREIQQQENLGTYHTLQEMEDEIKQAAQDYPQLAKYISAGTTFEGRPIHGLVLTNKESTVEKKSFLIMGTHHSREWISTEVPLHSIQDLLTKYASDPEARQILDTSIIVYVPMLNSDGGTFSRNESKMWRKNRNSNDSRYGTGVDNNRNYSYKWGASGSSGSKWSDVYKGPDPMSEAENQAVRALQEEYGFVASISFHSYSELVLWPWGYTTSIQAKDHTIFKKYGDKMGEIMDYEPMQSADLYPAAGDSDDYLYADYDVLAYTIELGTRFVPHEQQVPIIRKKGAKALRYLFLNARDPWSERPDDETYQLSSLLEGVVIRGRNEPSENRTNHFKTLAGFSRTDLHKAMDHLDMGPVMRARIFNELRPYKRFLEMESK